MKKIVFILISVILLSSDVFSQTPMLECGWNYYYDNAGNRTARLYYNCNSPSREAEDSVIAEIDVVTLYPNPTNGEVHIEFSQELENAEVIVSDNIGRLIYRQTHSGNMVTINLTNQPAATYHVIIRRNKDKHYSKKVVKTNTY